MALPKHRQRPKADQINLRVTEFQRNLMDHAAKVRGKNRTEFIVDAAVREAQAALSEQSTIFVDEETFDEFERLLNEPVPSTGALRELFATKAPWE
jgi:uncharacterized protein (DUF1778 family)